MPSEVSRQLNIDLKLEAKQTDFNRYCVWTNHIGSRAIQERYTEERQPMAVLNVRLAEEMKRKLAELAKAVGTSQSHLVKSAVEEKIAVHEVAHTDAPPKIPEWVPDGKYVALVRGAVAAVGDSVAEVVAAALQKFSEDHIHVARKGRLIKPVHYAFFAEATMKCWKYATVDEQSYPIIPITIVGKEKRVTAASSPDTAASLTLVSSEIVAEADLQPIAQETIATAAGPVKTRTFNAKIELAVGKYETVIASLRIPKVLPFQVLLGRNLLDMIDLYALGKTKVVCLKDP